MSVGQRLAIALLLVANVVQAQNAGPFDAAAAFGARPGVSGMSLSPDGQRVAYIAADTGQGSVLYIQKLEKGATPEAIKRTDGKPERLGRCWWAADDRLICQVYGVTRNGAGLVPWSRLVAIGADGTNQKVLSTLENEYSRGRQVGGSILDWLPDENGVVLMTRRYVPVTNIGSRIVSTADGLGVDRVDTRTLAVEHVEGATPDALTYISDGRGVVRIMGLRDTRGGRNSGTVHFQYRLPKSRTWRHLGDYNLGSGEGFEPLAVDHDLNLVYGLKKREGHKALYSVSLDKALHQQLVYSQPDIDVDGLVQIGRRRRVVAASYATATRHVEYFSTEVKQMLAGLAKTLPGAVLNIADANSDESRMIIFAGSDSNPGAYYLFDRKTRQLNRFLAVRDLLEGVRLAAVKPVEYRAADGLMVSAYLTLPPGREDAKGLPAIVLPQSGPSLRDEWGFDWLSQFFAQRGYAVLQPNFRGSTAYADAWFRKNGFEFWPIAIGDLLAGGHWLIDQGIADPSKLAVVGWSYGGYAALQSAVADQNTFKAVIAIAPVTDLQALKEESRHFSNFALVSEFVGDGAQMHAGSPIEHVDKFKVPVLLFHGAMDRDVNIAESQHMAERLKAVGARCELVTWDDLDHDLEDSSARTQMLRKSDAFLHEALGM